MQKILAKLHLIMSEVNYIQKDKTNAFHGYNYASEQAIKEKLHPLFVKYGIVFQVSATNSTHDTVVNAKGNTEDRVTTNFVYRFFDTESGESLEGTFQGCGQDSGDKGIYKAITGAIKYILTTTFLIPTGDDPEDDGEAPKERHVRVTADRETPETFKWICDSCGKGHNGRYKKCLECYKKKTSPIKV